MYGEVLCYSISNETGHFWTEPLTNDLPRILMFDKRETSFPYSFF